MTDKEILEIFINSDGCYLDEKGNPGYIDGGHIIDILVRCELARMEAEEKRIQGQSADTVIIDDPLCKPLTIKERPFKVGDKVWCFVSGADIISEINSPYGKYPIILDKSQDFYTIDGCYYIEDKYKNRALFHLDVAQSMGWVDMVVEIEGEKFFCNYRSEDKEDCTCESGDFIEESECIDEDALKIEQPAWKPEVGKLYRCIRNESELLNPEAEQYICEVDGIIEITQEEFEDTYSIKCDKYPDLFTRQTDELLRFFKPATELEGLKEGEQVYISSTLEETHRWTIKEITILADAEVCIITDSCQELIANLDGSVWVGGLKAWRTKERAEKYGRGE